MNIYGLELSEEDEKNIIKKFMILFSYVQPQIKKVEESMPEILNQENHPPHDLKQFLGYLKEIESDFLPYAILLVKIDRRDLAIKALEISNVFLCAIHAIEMKFSHISL